MAAPIRTPRAAWIEQGLRALAEGGPGAVRIEPLAQALGVTKGGFYWHFDDRKALLAEMLDAWERTVIDEVIERVEAGGGDARTRLRRLFGLARTQVTEELLAVELAVREWARRDQEVARRLKRVDNRRMAYTRSLFGAFCSSQEEVEVRCLLSLSLFVANHLIAADHGERSRRDVIRLAMRQLLE